MKNKKELTNMQSQMFKSMFACRDDFKNFTPLEKLQFTQKAFLDVNKYNAQKFNYNEEEVKFGFYLQNRESVAISYGSEVVACDISYILKCNNPFDIYRILMHESRHIHQHKNHTAVEKLSKIYSPIYNKSNFLWALGPGEIDADNYSYNQMSKIAKQGAKDFSNNEDAKEEYLKSVSTRIKEYGHIHKIGKALVKDVKDVFKNKEDNQNSTISRVEESSRYFFNLEHLEEIAKANNQLFSNCSEVEEQCRVIKQSIYDEETQSYSIYHRSYPFFMVFVPKNWEYSQAHMQVKPIEEKLEKLSVSEQPENFYAEEYKEFFNESVIKQSQLNAENNIEQNS